MSLKKIYFPVEKVPVVDLLPDHDSDSEISHAIVTGEKKILHYCAEGYELVTNEQIYKPIFRTLCKAFGKENIKTQVKMSRDAQFYVDFLLQVPEMSINIGRKNDIIIPRLRVQNSYNGKIKYAYKMGWWRLVCSNGASVPVEGTNVYEGTFLHTAQLSNGEAAKHLQTMATRFINEGASTYENFKVLLDRQVDDIEARITEIAEMVEFPKRQIQPAIERAFIEMKDFKIRSTDWLAYNGLTYILSNSDMKMEEPLREKLEKAIFKYTFENE